MESSKIEDTCSPGKNKKLYVFRAYYVFPVLLVILFFEAIYILASIPSGNLGGISTISETTKKLVYTSK